MLESMKHYFIEVPTRVRSWSLAVAHDEELAKEHEEQQ